MILQVYVEMTFIHDKKTKSTLTKLAVHISPRITEQDRFVLKLLLNKVNKSGMRVAEIGSFLGNGSTKTIIEEIKNTNAVFYCVDTWRGNQNVQWHLRLAEEYDLFATFLHHATLAGGQNIVKPMMMESEDAASIFKDKSCDFIFIDGDHSFEETKKDIELWMPKVKPGGILCGHDCEGAMSDFEPAVIEANLKKDFVHLEKFIFEGCHPGVVKAVDMLSKDVTLWAHNDLTEYGLSGRSSIWHAVL